uniref:N-terminal Ras-GEF domain-containing protein n=1 Tax=Oreochromis niloticus TaxID=8128 RepID=A0A669CIP2_ORENI
MTYSLSSFQLGIMGSSTLGKAASLDALLNECIHGFDDSGDLQGNPLPRIVLLMHRWYVTSSELAQKLLMIYPTLISTLIKDILYLHLSHVYLFDVQFQICVLRYWIVTFPAEFNLDLGLIRITEEFRDVAAQLDSSHLPGIQIHPKDISTFSC